MGAGTITSRLGALLFARSPASTCSSSRTRAVPRSCRDCFSGTVDFALDCVGSSLPLIQGGQFRALAKYSNRPLPLLPDLPSLTVAADLPELDESSTWIGLLAPAGTPARDIEKLTRGGEHLCRSGDAGPA